jgi:hypothetical protein
VATAAGSSPLRGGSILPGGGGVFCGGSSGVAAGARQGGAGGGAASCVVDSPLLAADLRSADGEGLISARVLGDVIEMAEVALR